MSDKRRCHRLDVELHASLEFDSRKKGQKNAATIDLSGLGLRISTKEKLKIGQVLPINIQLSGAETAAIKVKVVWIKENTALSGPEYSVGLKIVDSMECDEQRFIKYFAQELIQTFR